MGRKPFMTGEEPEITLDPTEVEALRSEATRLACVVEETYFDLGRILLDIARSCCYTKWGYSDFDAYVEGELSFQRRKAYYLMLIFSQATKLGLKIEDLAGIGWSKAKEILTYVDNRDDFDIWATKARKLSLRELIDAIRIDKGIGPKPAHPESINPVTGETMHQVTFSFTDGQYQNVALALETAKRLGKTDMESHALDLIALDFNSHNAATGDLAEKLAQWFVQAPDLGDRIAAAVNAGVLEELPPEEPS
jgi:hypothetical protein